MYQMTLFLNKVNYKNNNYLINTHQKISNCTIFFKFSWGSMLPDPPSKGHGFTIIWLCAVHCFDTCKFKFQKKNLDTLSNSVYSPDIHVQMN